VSCRNSTGFGVSLLAEKRELVHRGAHGKIVLAAPRIIGGDHLSGKMKWSRSMQACLAPDGAGDRRKEKSC
jgi:hypothetical protein